jgi:predicted RNA-binding protein YlqC (UPF0109 family)
MTQQGHVQEEVGEPQDELTDLLVTMVESIVDKPSKVEVSCANGREFLAFEVKCDPTDVGAMIGGKGAHAEAMRKIFSVASAKLGVRGTVQFIGREERSARRS